MKILVINCGSSSLKYQLIDLNEEQLLVKGLAENIGFDESVLKHSYLPIRSTQKEEMQHIEIKQNFQNHKEVFEKVAGLLLKGDSAIIQHKEEIHKVGHRIVHGGNTYLKSTRIDDVLKTNLKKIIPLANLHTPAHLLGIEAAESVFPNSIHYAVFDTSFHTTLPEKAYRYAIEEKYHKEYPIRVYGFHGISHEFVYHQAKNYFKKPIKAITLHLGNGASIAAINEKGESIDTSMGMGPVSGLMMGTRSGDIDPTVIFYMMEEMNLSYQEVRNILTKQSGMLGVGGSNDARKIKELYKKGDRKGVICYEMYTYRIKKYIGAYIAALNGCDCLAFTGGVGENDTLTRKLVCEQMNALGIILDEHKNEQYNHPQKTVTIHKKESKVAILIIPTNEELNIARKSKEV